MLGLLVISLWVIAICVDKGWNNHVWSLSGRGNSSSLKVPLEMFGGTNIRFKSNWQYAGLAVGMVLLLLVNIELILRQLITLMGGGDRLRPVDDDDMARAD